MNGWDSIHFPPPTHHQRRFNLGVIHLLLKLRRMNGIDFRPNIWCASCNPYTPPHQQPIYIYFLAFFIFLKSLVYSYPVCWRSTVFFRSFINRCEWQFVFFYQFFFLSSTPSLLAACFYFEGVCYVSLVEYKKPKVWYRRNLLKYPSAARRCWCTLILLCSLWFLWLAEQTNQPVRWLLCTSVWE